MESLKEEIMRVHKCAEHVVIESNSYTVSLLQFTDPREFVVISTETRGKCSLDDVNAIFACMTEFMENNPENSPCYCIIDLSRTDTFTLQQIHAAAESLIKIKALLETRLVGSIIKVNEDQSDNGYVTNLFQRIYTPVRPILWYNSPGEGSEFIRKWEDELK